MSFVPLGRAREQNKAKPGLDENPDSNGTFHKIAFANRSLKGRSLKGRRSDCSTEPSTRSRGEKIEAKEFASSRKALSKTVIRRVAPRTSRSQLEALCGLQGEYSTSSLMAERETGLDAVIAQPFEFKPQGYDTLAAFIFVQYLGKILILFA